MDQHIDLSSWDHADNPRFVRVLEAFLEKDRSWISWDSFAQHAFNIVLHSSGFRPVGTPLCLSVLSSAFVLACRFLRLRGPLLPDALSMQLASTAPADSGSADAVSVQRAAC